MKRQRTQLNNEKFIEKSRIVHGDKYDYSKVNYVNNKTKVTVVCPEHGDFSIRAVNHYSNGTGCAKCTGGHHWCNDEWIKEVTKVHDGYYDYSLTYYTGAANKVKVICPKHGEFEQEAGSHKSGAGCYHCRNDKLRYSLEDFILKSKVVHGDKYDYSLVEYKTCMVKVKIRCPVHGIFLQSPAQHIYGNGCKKCSGVGSRTTEDFVESARSVHGDRYDYSLVSYTRMKDRVDIICREHGVFKQPAANHLRGYNCPVCPRNNDQPTTLYILTNGEQIKIGFSNNVERRLYTVNLFQPFTSEFVLGYTLSNYHEASIVERDVHRVLKDFNAGFTGFDGATEWFNTTPDIASDVILNCIKENNLNYEIYKG